MDFISHNLEETKEAAQKLLADLVPGVKATVVGLTGDLGSGKTSITQAVAQELGIEEHVTSPTFVIMKIYSLLSTNYSFKNLVHIDAYRLKNAQELEVLKFKDYLADKNNLIIIEWPEIVKEILPEEMTLVRCRFVDENTRQFVW